MIRTATVFTLSILFAVSSLSGCAASPDDVCKHMSTLAEKDGYDGLDVKECVESVESQKEMQGYFSYRTQSRCIMDAESLDDAIKCDE